MIIGKIRTNRLPQGTKVLFEVDGKKCEGIIVGLACDGVPVIGRSYILEITKGEIDKNTYPYTHCVMFELHFDVIRYVDDKIIN